MITDISQLDLNQSYTYADYITWQMEEMVELIKGKIFRMSPAPRKMHQEICQNLHLELGNYLRKSPCKVYIAPFDVRFVRNRNDKEITTVTQPDLCIVCDASKLDEAGCLGAPDFIIEITSPSTRSKDIHQKFSLYEEFGVREYWIVEPQAQTIDQFVLENNKYQLKGKYTRDDTMTLHILPELTIEMNDIFEEVN